MAIIQCPECSRDISDKSASCIHCGFPLNLVNNALDETEMLIADINSLLSEEKCTEQLYKVFFKGFSTNEMYNRNRIEASGIIGGMLSWNSPGADGINCNRKCILLDGLSYNNAKKMQTILKKYGCITVVQESEEVEYHRVNKKIERLEDDSGVLKCPKCNSTAVTIGQRGYSMVFGFLGSNDTLNRCGKCGYKWKP